MKGVAAKRAPYVLLIWVIFAVFATAQAATTVIRNADPPGVGFNSTSTQIKPAAGNPGATLGQQRLNAVRFAARLLASKIKSNVTIQVKATFDAGNCRPREATLGRGGPINEVTLSNPPPGARGHVFYPTALANALAGSDQDPGPDISINFNGAIDNNPQCLGDGRSQSIDWYYGYDGKPPVGAMGRQSRDLDFLSTALHELIHGLGFETITNLSTGEFPKGGPDIFATQIRDLTRQATWPQLTASQRQRSATNAGNVVWDGSRTTEQGAPTLTGGVKDGMVQLYAPARLSPGSSISHWDTAVTPDALMEPLLGDTLALMDEIGLAACALEDMGWQLKQGTVCPDMTSIAVSPRGVTFGQAGGGQSAVHKVTVTNAGNKPLTLGNVAKANPLAAPFSIGADNCSGKQLAPAESCRVMLTYAPANNTLVRDSFDVAPANGLNMSSVTIPVTGGRKVAGPQVNTAGAGNANDGGGSSGGGGGCAMQKGPVPFGPVFPAAVVFSLLLLVRRWTRGR